ncbi:MAG TPA: NrfD/PsrC family molybdoenzyme membrane anchor subunit [Verrucomicrobiae bacterium]|jgi:molybdopterin-containing oxidoreductase family membrane subunit|nr:NrfD/PsrC family molybdoenzyme membrane anchor subunit [Verrucomicrobiae bacterium]
MPDEELQPSHVTERRPAVALLGYPTQILAPGQTYASVTEEISSIVLTRKHPRSWWFGFAIAFGLLMMFLFAVTVLLFRGVGIWGINIPVAWGFAIVNFVWWVGIGHAGTFISAILLLLLQKWRTAINRLTEAMTLFAVACAGLFPLLHLGRPFVFFWLFPYPDTMDLWPQFRSPLVWDVFAVSTYFTVSLIFWYVGLLPDLATLRDRATTRPKQWIYGMLALGWRGSAVHWQRHQSLYLLLAGLATPLVLSVHSVVSFDFAVAMVPGWHSTIFPPYFVAGAIYSGFAMVLNILIPIRKLYGLEGLIPMRYLNNMANVMLATGWMVTYGYIMEAFMAWYSGDVFERSMMWNRAFGPYGWVFWMLILFNCVIPQLLWSRRVRTNLVGLFCVALFINVGMWIERFVIVISSLSRDFTPSAWHIFIPTKWDLMTLFGSMGLFFTLLFLFIRFLPLMSISEVRKLVSEEKEAKP